MPLAESDQLLAEEFADFFIEKAAINQLVQHVDDHDLSPHYQAAYKKIHSCETS